MSVFAVSVLGVLILCTSGTFSVFATACFVGYLWSTYVVPETANVSLEDIDELFGSTAGREDTELKFQVCSLRNFNLNQFLLFRSNASWGCTISSISMPAAD